MHRYPFIIAMALISFLALPTVQASSFTKGREVAPFTSGLKPGEYVWKPEISPAGPVVILVSLPDQIMYVYRNGVRIGRSTVSTGAKGHATPTGVFTILQKKVRHESSIYKGAQMPHMQRLTWTGIAMHAGNLPGYPASHGCVRLPEDFAEKLYSVTTLGTVVIIAGNKSGPDMTTKPGLLFSRKKNETAPAGAVVWKPERAPSGPVSVMVSVADGRVYVYRDGVEIGRAPVRGLRGISGSYAYSALAATDGSG
ncbi:MAG TPA: L,D-transpeptidase family protein, partial [Candidatus Methylacidiphilales bacterium]|nr:L,D-transpeptidase family protein [Candidatus Methylacidiphilales bacterium]